jgi:hypothetical protein
MAKDPAFLFYPSDFLVGTSLMTTEEIGQYIILLCHLSDKETLSYEEMVFILKNEPSNKVLGKLSKKTSGRYFNQRLEDEVKKRREYTKSRRVNSLGKKKGKAYAKHMDTHMENENENEKTVVVVGRKVICGKVQKVEKRQDVINKKGCAKAVNKLWKTCGSNVNEKKKTKTSKNRHSEYVFLTIKEYSNLIEKMGKHQTQEYIEKLNDGIGSKGYKYKSHYYTILCWWRKDNKPLHPKDRQEREAEELKQKYGGIPVQHENKQQINELIGTIHI